MAWVRFLRAYDYRPKEQVVIAYKAGKAYSVRSECAEAAVKQLAAVRITTPPSAARRKASL